MYHHHICFAADFHALLAGHRWIEFWLTRGMRQLTLRVEVVEMQQRMEKDYSFVNKPDAVSGAPKQLSDALKTQTSLQHGC